MISDRDSVTAGEEHPDTEEISAFREGVLPEGRSRQVRSHIAACSRCAEVEGSLSGIQELLGEFSGPVQMPADIAERIEAALTAEALAASDTPKPPSLSQAPDHDEARRVRSSAQPASSSTRPGPTGPAGPVGPARGSRSGPGRGKRPYRRRGAFAVLGAACGAALLAFGTFLVGTSGLLPGTGSASRDAGASAAGSKEYQSADTSAPSTNRIYTDDTLAPMVRLLLTRTGRDSDLSTAQEEGESSKSPLVAPRQDSLPSEDAQRLPACVLAATQRRSEPPLATDIGQYRGKRAGVVVLPDRDDESLVKVYLVDLSCADISPRNPGTVLLERSVPRR